MTEPAALAPPVDLTWSLRQLLRRNAMSGDSHMHDLEGHAKAVEADLEYYRCQIESRTRPTNVGSL
jgi:hypothetical protein